MTEESTKWSVLLVIIFTKMVVCSVWSSREMKNWNVCFSSIDLLNSPLRYTQNLVLMLVGSWGLHKLQKIGSECLTVYPSSQIFHSQIFLNKCLPQYHCFSFAKKKNLQFSSDWQLNSGLISYFCFISALFQSSTRL